MTLTKEFHLRQLKKRLVYELDKKYRKGDKEHKDNLLRIDKKVLIKELRAELLDALVYLDVIERKL